jgi:hypothetical protein
LPLIRGLVAGHHALGQILTYVAHARAERDDRGRQIRGVIAAFDFDDDLPFVIETMNLGIELVTLPSFLRSDGSIRPCDLIRIPLFNR